MIENIKYYFDIYIRRYGQDNPKKRGDIHKIIYNFRSYTPRNTAPSINNIHVIKKLATSTNRACRIHSNRAVHTRWDNAHRAGIRDNRAEEKRKNTKITSNICYNT